MQYTILGMGWGETVTNDFGTVTGTKLLFETHLLCEKATGVTKMTKNHT